MRGLGRVSRHQSFRSADFVVGIFRGARFMRVRSYDFRSGRVKPQLPYRHFGGHRVADPTAQQQQGGYQDEEQETHV